MGKRLLLTLQTALLVNSIAINVVIQRILTIILCAQEMAGALVEHLTTDTQMKLYRGTVLTVLKKCGEEVEIDDQVYYIMLCMKPILYTFHSGGQFSTYSSKLTSLDFC